MNPQPNFLRRISILQFRQTLYRGVHEPAAGQGEATPVDEGRSRLKVTFLPEFVRWIPFTKGDYWVLKLADDYLVSLVGTPIADFCGCFRKLLRRAPLRGLNISRRRNAEGST